MTTSLPARSSMQSDVIRGLLLLSPLIVLLLVGFFVPVLFMLRYSVYDTSFSRAFPSVIKLSDRWGDAPLPPDEVLAAIAADLSHAQNSRAVGGAAAALNFAYPGGRSLIMKTARAASRFEPAPLAQQFMAVDSRWSDPVLWMAIKRLISPITISHYLSTLDLYYDKNGAIARRDSSDQIYLPLLAKTLLISGVVTLATLLIGYPFARFLCLVNQRTASVLLIFVLLPFWTSLLVRTTAWIAILQQQGILNDLFVALGLVSDDNRPRLIFNMTGTVIVMVHVMLPFMILPLYSAMKTIPPVLIKAAESLGAGWIRVFWRIYLPLSLPGIIAGSSIVFIVGIGYYITPALVGGVSGTLISNMIAYHMQQSLNWGLASALGMTLLVVVLLFQLSTRLLLKVVRHGQN